MYISQIICCYLWLWLHVGPPVWLIVSKMCERDFNTSGSGLFAGNIDETINADSIRSEDRRRRDSNTGCLIWHAFLTLVFSNTRCHNVSVIIFMTWSRNKFKFVSSRVFSLLLRIRQLCSRLSTIYSRERHSSSIRFPTIL